MDAKICPACHTKYPAEAETCALDGALLQEEGEWLPGKVIRDQYVIFRRVGQNDVAVCYKARALEFDEVRAITALRPGLARDQAAAKEFRRTAALLEQAAHSGLIRVEASGEAEDGRPFVVSELVEGASLADVMRSGGALEPLRVCSLARQAAAALEAAHRRGLLHLDLKPSNVLLAGTTEDQQVKLQGFGVAYVRAGWLRNAQRSGARVTLQKLVAPNLPYCSPEQALGRPVELLDARSDLYSLGVLMYEMLAGRPPFPRPAAAEDGGLASLVAQLESPPLPLAALTEGFEIPKPLLALAMQLLETRRELRPASARAVAEKIELIEARSAARIALAREFPPLEAREAAAPVASGADAPPPGRERSAPASALSAAAATSEVAPAESLNAGEACVDTPVQETVLPPPAAGVSQPDLLRGLSILSQAEPSPPRPSRIRWIWAAAVALAFGALAWFFVTRSEGPKPGPLAPSGAVSKIQGEAAAPGNAPSPPAAQPQGAGQSSTLATQSSQSPPASAANSSASPPALLPPSSPSTGGIAPRSPAGVAERSLGSTSSLAVGHPASAGKASTQPHSTEPGADELAAGVKRAVAAGDVFFNLGQYDEAIRAYQGPLKLDPKNKLLLGKIERAKRAQQAEQDYLKQQ